MSWRLVAITKRCKLDFKMGYLVIRNDEGVKRIYLNEIHMLIIENIAVSITGILLYELTLHKIKVIVCDDKRNPYAEFINCYGSHDSSRKLEKQICWNKYTKQIIWSEIVADKIRKQSQLLKEFNKLKEANILKNYIKEIEVADVTNREGHAAKVYFNGLFGSDFVRSADNAINAGLNYGYSLILSAFNREIVANGYSTQLGIFHNNMFNHFNLSYDLMEPFRILVDKVVKSNDFFVFEKEQKYLLLDLFNETIIIEGRKQFVNNAIKIYCKSVLEAIEENDVSLIKFYNYEL